LGALAAQQKHEIVALVRPTSRLAPGLLPPLNVDFSDLSSVRSAMLSASPNAIVNCMAVSSPSDCERMPAYSHHINVVLPRLFAQVAREMGVRLIHLSSEQVFDGNSDAPYTPRDVPSPLNCYGRQKVESEQAVQEYAGNLTATVRAPLLLGNSLTGTRSVHEQLIGAWASGQTPTLFTDEYRQPCATSNLAEVLLALCLDGNAVGIFHWAGLESVSRYELAVRIRAHFGLTEVNAPLRRQTRADNPVAARLRPRSLRIDIAPLCTRITVRPLLLVDHIALLRVPDCYAQWHGAQAQLDCNRSGS
jgi:dTDP-4-dehydrorhamnose reductase